MRTEEEKQAARSRGGKTRAARMSAEERSEAAGHAVRVREAKRAARLQAVKDLARGEETGEYPREWFDALPE